jgi:hypothetical protein
VVLCPVLIHIQYHNGFGTQITNIIALHLLACLWVGMQTSVVASLLVTSSVLLACVVINYAVGITEQTIDTKNSPHIDRIRELETMVLNQTYTMIKEFESFNQTATEPID